MQERFINAIHSKNKIKVTFHSKEDGRNLGRVDLWRLIFKLHGEAL
ncbi:hypothetical protein GCM10007916_28750 [Psychromonas marina]|uniref:Uncharacterized protein n=1 Tax=Psychromonas marina TaxID=88364 RepID=A0ABQ6E3L6_9GAMM|nr:hypothetical protein [Psychromonas marina]GLS91805.1 hypothetical protein GCM10007916_28750 [Psychromonas marina]